MSEGLRLQLKYICVFGAFLWLSSVGLAQNTRNLTPLEVEIAKQQQRLSSGSEEERRDAIMKLGGMRAPAAARAALPGLKDPSPIVRAIAAKAILLIGG